MHPEITESVYFKNARTVPAAVAWCWDGHLARVAEYAGMSYAGLLESILAACAERLAQTRQWAEHIRAA
jgi:hypothetical protein